MQSGRQTFSWPAGFREYDPSDVTALLSEPCAAARFGKLPHFLVEYRDDAARQIQHDEDDQNAVGQHVQAAVRGEDGAGIFRDERHDDRAEDRTRHCADAAHDDHKADHRGFIQREQRIRVDVGDVGRVEAAGQADDGRAEHVGKNFVFRRVDADALRGRFIGLDRAQVIPEFGFVQIFRKQHQQRRDAEKQIVERVFVLELQRVPFAVGLVQEHDAGRAAEAGGVEQDDARALRDGHSGDQEVGTVQAEQRLAEHEGQGDGDGDADPDAQPRGHVEMLRAVGHSIGADGIKQRVAVGDLTGVAADEVPADAHDGPDQAEHEHVDGEVGRQQQRQHCGDHETGGEGDPEGSALFAGFFHVPRLTFRKVPWAGRSRSA